MLRGYMDADWLASRSTADENGCWLWSGSRLPAGYGGCSWRIDGKNYGSPAHRVAYRIVNGPIPEGYQVHHECGVRPCVNPEHLVALSATTHHELHDLMLSPDEQRVRDRGEDYFALCAAGVPPEEAILVVMADA